MNKRKIFILITYILFFQLFYGCFGENSGRAGRPLISLPGTVITVDYCTGNSTDAEDCVENYCTGNEDQDTEDCVENYCTGDEDQDNASCIENYCIGDSNIDNASCVLKIEKRPDRAVFVNKNFCSCLEGNADSLNNCESFCSDKSHTEVPTLYASVTLGPEIELNEKLETLYNWCFTEINDNNNAPSCILRLYDGINTIDLTPKISTSSNSFTAELIAVDQNRTYIVKLIEITSGAESTPFQIHRIDLDENNDYQGSLKIIPISQYTCITWATVTGHSVFYDNTIPYDYKDAASRTLYYYFPNNIDSSSLTLSPAQIVNDRIFCHDINIQPYDSPLLDRLEEVPHAFTLWDSSDLRFFDINPTDSVLDINGIIQQELLDIYNIQQDIKIFAELDYYSRPPVMAESQDDNVNTIMRLGFYMQPWVSHKTGLGFCPTEVEYNGTDPIFRILKDIIGVPTEAIYLAKKEPESLTDENGNIITTGDSGDSIPLPTVYIIIRESLLKKIWFYYNDGRHYTPNDETAGQQSVMFYWPPDVNNPYIQKSEQKIFTIVDPTNLSSTEDLGLRTSVSPPDKRIGCVPNMGGTF